MPDDYKANLYALWSIQDALLQSYRTLFIAVQTVCAGFATTGELSRTWPISALALALMFFAWLPVTWARGRAVSFVQWLIQRAENGLFVAEPLAEFKRFQDKASGHSYGVRFSSNDERDFCIPSVCSDLAKFGTRAQMDLVVPFFFFLIWLWVLSPLL